MCNNVQAAGCYCDISPFSKMTLAWLISAITTHQKAKSITQLVFILLEKNTAKIMQYQTLTSLYLVFLFIFLCQGCNSKAYSEFLDLRWKWTILKTHSREVSRFKTNSNYVLFFVFSKLWICLFYTSDVYWETHCVNNSRVWCTAESSSVEQIDGWMDYTVLLFANKNLALLSYSLHVFIDML